MRSTSMYSQPVYRNGSKLKRMEANESLSAKQGKMIASLLAGHTIVAAARIAGISEVTAHRWLKQEAFQEAYRAAKDQLFEDALDEIKIGLVDAIKALRKHLTADVEPTAATQIAAIRTWVEQAVNIHTAEELDARIQELENHSRGNNR